MLTFTRQFENKVIVARKRYSVLFSAQCYVPIETDSYAVHYFKSSRILSGNL